MRFFNTAGPSVPGQHYMIDPLARLDLPDVEALIDQQRYFVLHAPRQTGKTSCLLALMHHLNAQGRYQALYANVEAAQAARGDVAQGMATIMDFIEMSAQIYLHDTRFKTWKREVLAESAASGALATLLSRWTQASDKPTVLMLDEIDALVGDTLISALRQLRAGYAQRPAAFPQSVILCGVRDVRDYRIHAKNQEIITGGSAFNIKTKSLRLGNFSRAETEELFRQHTADTGQTFAPEIFDELWQDTQGQPWLVNAMGYELTWEDKAARDRSMPITLKHYSAARERLIQSRATHLDQLTDKLREPRVHGVVAALMQGEAVEDQLPPDDVQYVEDLGLIVTRPQLAIANRIYRETIPRELTWTVQMVLPYEQVWYLTPERRLDMGKLLSAFQQFFREHADSWLERFDYKEAGPQLLLQAFLQRVVNGGGRINREYGLGRRRTDLFLEWPLDEAQGFYGPVQRVVIELKLLHKSLEQTLAQGLEQTADYADRCGADEAHLIIFDRRPGVAWEEKIWQRSELHGSRAIAVWGA
ncbi:MAG: AAA family ATPase [Methylococcaceae bacterium]|nr:MAG: AAA family ATPase [Methylococcaceae bacterium]